jgi:general secretion pathway protein J
VLTVQSGLAQWGADLDAMIQLPQTQALEWDGRALRLTRQSPGDEGVVVVAWSRRDIDGTGQWLRWQSPPLRTRGDFQTAWSAAAQWAQNPGDDLKKREVRLGPLSQWQIFYFRNDAWTNPLSSSGAPLTGSAANIAAALAIAIPSTVASAVPEGVRLVLTLPPGQAISGVLTRDWLRPTLGGGKS